MEKESLSGARTAMASRHGPDEVRVPAPGKPERADAPEGTSAAETETEMAVDAEAERSSGGFVSHLHAVAGAVAPVAGALGTALGAANSAWSGRSAAIERRLHRQAREPLANLYEMYPEARAASPRELGLRFVPVEEIRGTAVAGATQRGGDFLPLKPLRGENWESRWQRIRSANERLQPLPPVDLVKFDGDYWVVDGHNRVAVALYVGGAGLDAMVTELVPLDGQTSERPSQLLAFLGEAGELRAAAQGYRPAIGMRYSEQHAADAADAMEGSSADELPAAHPAAHPAANLAADPEAEH
jgi:hypothetical protein